MCFLKTLRNWPQYTGLVLSGPDPGPNLFRRLNYVPDPDQSLAMFTCKFIIRLLANWTKMFLNPVFVFTYHMNAMTVPSKNCRMLKFGLLQPEDQTDLMPPVSGLAYPGAKILMSRDRSIFNLPAVL